MAVNALKLHRINAVSILDTLREPVVILNQEFRVRKANRSFFRVFQGTPEETQNTVLFELGNGQWDIPALRTLLEDVLTKDLFFEDFEMEHNFPQIGHKFMLLNARQILQEDDLDPLILLAIEDITAYRIAEGKANVYARHLERSNRELQNFAVVASHDLQEPLRKIQTFGDLLKEEYGEVLEGEAKEYIDTMQSGATRMRRLINDLLELSRVTTQGQPFSKVNLVEIIKEVSDVLELRFQETGGSMEVGNLPMLEADASQMKQLFQNLISNALKFHRKDEPPRIRINSWRGNGTSESPEAPLWTIELSDNGIGFESKYTDRIFDLFQRLHSRDDYEGTGIGLSICRKIMERHGGSLNAQSVCGQGATFKMVFPFQMPPSQVEDLER